MADEKEYRVKEIRGNFIIEVKGVEEKTTGFLWWRKVNKEIRWYRAGENGGRTFFFFHPRIVNHALPPYKTIEEAKQKIKEFNAKPIYHYVE